VDDEQGPWWTRPPEPGPQAPPVQRRRISGQGDVEVDTEEPTAEPATIAYPPTEYTRPRLVQPPPVEDEPQPPPPPKLAKPVVRRVAVVQPAPPPVRPTQRDPGEDRTESLPPVGDDIFATFSGPLPVDAAGPTAGGSDPGQSPASGRRWGNGRRWPGNRLDGAADDDGAPGLLPPVRLPEPRVLLLAAAAALVGVLIVVVALVTGRGTKADSDAGAPAVLPSPVAGASALTGRTPDGLKQVSALDAAALLRKAGRGPGGSIVEAWGWNDRNGQNLVVTSVASAGSNKRTLRVTHVAGLDGDARTLRVMKDPNLPTNCRGTGTAAFTPKALVVRDLDSNNVAEVITGWTSRCGGPENRSQIKLALITNGDKYILRGQGVIGQPGTLVPAPRPARWPDGFLKMLSTQYRTLYG
jgi:hypothetical protein